MSQHRGIPDMRFINRKVPIREVARVLDLRLDGSHTVHCWHPERHQQGDRTASVGIRTTNNTVKCFGCDSPPMGPIDLVMDTLGFAPAEAALWIAERFRVPTIPAHRRLTDPNRRRYRAGYEQGLELLGRSGLLAALPEAARAIGPVLLALSEKPRPTAEEFPIQISYAGISRYSGVRSPNSIRKALIALNECGFIKLPVRGIDRGPERASATYIVTPCSDQLYELAQTMARQTQVQIATEIELRDRLRKERISLVKGKREQRA